MMIAVQAQRHKADGYLEELKASRLVVVDDEAHDYRPATIRSHPPEALKLGKYRKDPDFTNEDGWADWVDQRLEHIAVEDAPMVGRWQRTALRHCPDMAGSPLDILAAVFTEKYVPLHPMEWEALGATELAEYAADSLVLFDRELKMPRTGDDLAEAFLERHPDARVAIFTNTVDIGADEIESANTLAKKHPVLITSKAHLPAPEQLPRFVDELRLTAIAKHLDAVRTRLLDLAEDAHKAAVDAVKSMGLRVLEAVMIGSSRREGVFEADTLIRVLTIEYRHAFRERFLDNDSAVLNELLADLEPARSQRAPDEQVIDSEAHARAEKLMTRERYAEGEIINRAGLPLACGDIFANNGDLWILLEQPCDLQLRDGTDTREHISHAELVRIRAGEGQGRVWPLPPATDLLPHPHHLVLKERIAVPFDVLELAVFRKDGRCAWTVGAAKPDVTAQTPALVRRFANIKAHLEALADVRGQVPDAYLLRAGDIIGTSSEEELRWPLRRVQRLHESWAAAALSAAFADRGRVATEHDLT